MNQLLKIKLLREPSLSDKLQLMIGPSDKVSAAFNGEVNARLLLVELFKGRFGSSENN